MKFIDSPSISAANAQLDGLTIGNNCRLNSRLEVFSCKRVGEEKKLARSLDEKLIVDSNSPGLSSSPFGPLQIQHSRKTFINLISLLNTSFPDYDFSGVSVDQFTKADSLGSVQSSINSSLNSVVPNYYPSISNSIWAAIDADVALSESVVYTYVPGPDDPFTEPGTLWSFNYFFVNRKLRRVAFFTAGVNSLDAWSPLSSAAVVSSSAPNESLMGLDYQLDFETPRPHPVDSGEEREATPRTEVFDGWFGEDEWSMTY